MNIQIQYTLTPDDLRDFLAAFRGFKTDPKIKRGLNIGPLGCGSVVIGLILLYAFAPKTGTSVAPAAPARTPLDVWLSITPWIVFVALISFFYSRAISKTAAAKRIFKSDALFAEGRAGEIDANALTLRLANSSATYQWPHFIRFIETPNAFLLFSGPRAAQEFEELQRCTILPKRAFTSPGDLETFRGFASSHIGGQPMGFPVLPPTSP